MKKQLTTQIYKGLLKKYYDQLYSNELNNLNEMDIYLKMHKISKLNQKESKNLNRLRTPEEIEAIFKNLPARGSKTAA